MTGWGVWITSWGDWGVGDDVWMTGWGVWMTGWGDWGVWTTS